MHAERRRRLHSAPSLPWMWAAEAPPDRPLAAALALDSAGTMGDKAGKGFKRGRQVEGPARRESFVSMPWKPVAARLACRRAGGEEAAGQSAGKEGG